MIRIGMARVLQGADVRTVGQSGHGTEGLAQVRANRAAIFFIGEHHGSTTDLIRHAKQLPDPPIVITLLTQLERDELAALLIAGADGLLSRSIGPEELVDALDRIVGGERVLSPLLLPSLVGVVSIDSDTDSEGAGDHRGLLTGKEREVLSSLADGRSNHEIALAMFVSAATVKTHLTHIYGKLGVRSRHEALARAVALGLLN
jgi:DNA-binding NarL/FixJ family response regulator